LCRTDIDVDADFFLSAWFVPLKVLHRVVVGGYNATSQAGTVGTVRGAGGGGGGVLHFNGGFVFGDHGDSPSEDADETLSGLELSRAFHGPAFVFAKDKSMLSSRLALEGGAGPGSTSSPAFGDVCGNCMPDPRTLTSDLMHGKCEGSDGRSSMSHDRDSETATQQPQPPDEPCGK
jgi:hypothetical protein